jgi:hypothetical protein
MSPSERPVASRADGDPRVSLAHDYLLVMHGAESTFAAIAELYPQAPIFTLLYDEQGTSERFLGRSITTSQALASAVPSSETWISMTRTEASATPPSMHSFATVRDPAKRGEKASNGVERRQTRARKALLVPQKSAD